MLKKHLTIIFVSLSLIIPNLAMALTLPQNGNELADMVGIRAAAYAVMDIESGQVVISKNPALPRIPASLTKLVTVLVVLDAKPKMSKAVAMTSADQAAGLCLQRGVCIKSKAGVKFSVDGLLHAALILSANNAASALARSTGFSAAEFAAKMNEKALSLGAKNSYFVEPTGLDPNNIVTAEDYVKIVAAAFASPYLSKIAGLPSYALRSTNNSKYNQTIKNSNKLLADSDIQLLGAKTGYLDESSYNFAALIKYRNGGKFAVVVLGEDHLYNAFAETKTLAKLADEARVLAILRQLPIILGTSTLSTFNN